MTEMDASVHLSPTVDRIWKVKYKSQTLEGLYIKRVKDNEQHMSYIMLQPIDVSASKYDELVITSKAPSFIWGKMMSEMVRRGGRAFINWKAN
jgi:hypothetical protein